MAAIDAEKILHLQVSQDLDGNRLTNGFYYAASAGITDSDAEALVDSFEALVLPSWQGAVSTDLRFDMEYCYCVEPNLVRPWMNGLTATNGTFAAVSNPSNVGAVLQFRQHEISGRSNGRVFIPGIPISVVVDGLLTGAYVSTELDAFTTALMAPLNNGAGTTFNLCVLNRMSGGVAVVPQGYLVSEVIASLSPGTQRRRTTELRGFG